MGDYKRAMLEYEALTHTKSPPKVQTTKIMVFQGHRMPHFHSSAILTLKTVWINLACCYFYLGMYSESEKTAEKADKSRLKTRLLFHLAHKFGDEKKLMQFHQAVTNCV